MAGRRGALLDWLAAGAIGAAVFAWFGHAFLNYDSVYAVVWGNDLAHGRTPDYGAPVAPTPHPLTELVGIVLSPFGAGAEDLMLAFGLLALGMLVVGIFHLGRELFGIWAGLVAAAIIATRVPILNFGIRGYVDLPTAAFVTWAALLEVRRPHRGAPVLILFGLAGLLRPEAWLYGAAYWLWLVTTAPKAEPGAAPDGHSPDARRTQLIRWGALAAAAPLIWLGSDLLITGNPLHSLTGTQDLAAELNRKTGLTALPEVVPRRLGEILRLPELLAAVVGFVFALRFPRVDGGDRRGLRRWAAGRASVPLAIAALNGVAYTAFAIARLPLLGRYLFVAAAMLAVFAGAGVFGWTQLPPDHPARRIWRPVGIAALLAIVVLFPLQQVGRLNTLRDDIAKRDRIQADLKDLVRRPDVKQALRACPRVYVLTHRPVPLVALYADLPPSRITVPTGQRRGCAIVPRTAEVASLAVLDPNEPFARGAYVLGQGTKRNSSWEFAPRASITGTE